MVAEFVDRCHAERNQKGLGNVGQPQFAEGDMPPVWPHPIDVNSEAARILSFGTYPTPVRRHM